MLMMRKTSREEQTDDVKKREQSKPEDAAWHERKADRKWS